MRWLLAPIAAITVLAPCCEPALYGQIWRPEGPSPIDPHRDEIILNTGGPQAVGAANDVIPHPTAANTIWVGTVNGGIWKTTTATAAVPSWQPLGDHLYSLSIGALALDPTDLGYKTLVAGTGARSSYGDAGEMGAIFRSVDGGDSWQRLPGQGLASWESIVGIAARGAIILASGFGGIYRSTDGGATFSNLSEVAGSGVPSGWCRELAADPLDPARLYAVMHGFAGGASLHRTLDTGATWVELGDDAFDAVLSDPSFTRARVAVGQAGQVFLAIAVAGRLTGLYRSGEGGESWTSLDVPAIHGGGQAWWHMSLAADPVNANLAYVGGDWGSATSQGNIYRVDASSAPGAQLAPLNWSDDGAGGGTASGTATHADSRNLAFDVAGNLLEVDDGGIYLRTLPRTNDGDWYSLNGTLEVTELHDVAWDAVSNRVIGGAQDNGTPAQLRETPPLRPWEQMWGGDGSDVAVDDRASATHSTLYLAAQFDTEFVRQTFDGAGALVALDRAAGVLVGGGDPPAGQFVTPLVLNATDPLRLVIGAANGVYESEDRGDTIRAVAPGLSAGGAPGALAFGAFDNPDVLYVGAESEIWVRTGPPPNPPIESQSFPGRHVEWVRHIVLDPADSRRAFVCTAQNVYMTSDAGGSWSTLTGDLLASGPGRLNALAFVPGARPQLVVATVHGVFASEQASGYTAWSRVGSGLPNVIVTDLELDAVDGILVAGTLGRGAWSVRTPLPPPGEWVFGDGFESGTFAAWLTIAH